MALTDEAISQLRQMIQSGELPPGPVLSSEATHAVPRVTGRDAQDDTIRARAGFHASLSSETGPGEPARLIRPRRP